MTYGEYLNEKTKNTKILTTLAIIMAGYFMVSIVMKNILLSLLMSTIWVIPALAIYSVIKDRYNKKKMNEVSMALSDNMEIQFIKRKKARGHNSFGIELLMWPLTLLCLIMIIDTTSNISSQLFHIGVTTIVLTIFFIYSKKLNKHHLILFDKGLIMNHKLSLYDNIKKYQSIKLRNSDYILEVQINEQYSSMVLSKEDVDVFEAALAMAST